MFKKILIANRGEIAVRIIRACKDLGIKTVAVHSTADSNAMHVRMADESVCVGGPYAKDSYLNIPALIAACEITGSEAIHPGYGFLSENYNFAQILSEHNITFIGPKAEHIQMMGDKITAKVTAQKLGLKTVPGSDGELKNADHALEVAETIGYPVLLKATAGGGGRGMKVVYDKSEMLDAFNITSNEAEAAFLNRSLYMEKYLAKPKHIEFQVFGDGKGKGLHFMERDCSLQRRHQKILEEAASPVFTPEMRSKLGQQAADAVAKMGYSGAGTFEFLYENGELYFIEMNTRIQVEHPATEMITNHDIVQEQILVAAGYDLTVKQSDIHLSGHAIEFRINAEDPANNFAPSPGKINHLHIPGGYGVRVDTALYAGYSIPPYYDSLVAKIIVHGKNRTECIARSKRALSELVIDGIKTTTPLHLALLDNPHFVSGQYDIKWLGNYLDSTKNKG